MCCHLSIYHDVVACRFVFNHVSTILLSRVKNSVPTKKPDLDPSPPDRDYELGWIYGVQAQTNRNNVRYSANKKILYHVAAVGVRLDHKSEPRSQSYFHEMHSDDIISMAQTLDRRLVGVVHRTCTRICWNVSFVHPLKAVNYCLAASCYRRYRRICQPPHHLGCSIA